MDEAALTPAQRRVVDDLLDWSNRACRPRFAPELAADLRDELEAGFAPVADLLGVGELRVNKHGLAQILACEAHHVAERAAGFGGWSPRAARGTVAHKAIELSLFRHDHPPPLTLVDDAVDRLIADDSDRSPGRWLATAGEGALAELRAQVNDMVVKFLESWPPLDRAWRPRTESSAWIDLCEGRITLHAKVDLALGQARGNEARVLVVDLKSGYPHASHRDDLRYYALVETLRSGVPPFRVATYYLDSCSFLAEEVNDDLLRSAMARVVDGGTRIAELHLRTRPPTISPGPSCGWCPSRDDCDGPARWAAERESLGIVDDLGG